MAYLGRSGRISSELGIQAQNRRDGKLNILTLTRAVWPKIEEAFSHVDRRWMAKGEDP